MKKLFVLLLIVMTCSACEETLIREHTEKEERKPKRLTVALTEDECEKYSGWGIYCDGDDENRKDIVKLINAVVGYKTQDAPETIGEIYYDNGWRGFTKNEVIDEVDGFMKIEASYYSYGWKTEEVWFDKKEIIFYEELDPRMVQRKKFEKNVRERKQSILKLKKD